MAEQHNRSEQEQGLQPRRGASEMERRGQVQYYGDREWHRGMDRYGNPVWYRAFGWSYRSDGGQAGEYEEEPHTHGRTRSRHYQRSDERIREDVYDRLNDHPNLDSSDIRVNVSGGEVTLEGTVHSRREKRLAEDIAEGVSGVTDVQNRLRPEQPGGMPGGGEASQAGQSQPTAVAGQTAPHHDGAAARA